ncbi:MAG: ATP-binding protein [Nostocoides sp.]
MRQAERDDFGSMPGAGSVRTLRPRWAATSVGRIRRAVVADLTARGVPPSIIDEAELVVSELASNSIRHAAPLADGNIRVRWKVKGATVDIEVTDGGGQTIPRPSPRVLWAPGGRGLRIVRSLAHEWGVIEESAGMTVWAALGGPSRRRTG